jgi:hypothetical protein
MISISDKGKALAALCAEKDMLNTLALELNELSQRTIDEYTCKMLQISTEQIILLKKMVLADEAIEKISRSM